MTKKKMVEFTPVTDYQQTFRICLTDIWEEICKEQYFEDEAYDRSGYNYDPDENWAIDTYENGLVSENCHWAETTCEDGEEDDD